MSVAAAELFARCVLPGCDAPSEHPGVPCGSCLAELGDYLQPVPGQQPLTAEQVAQRDAEQRAATRAQLQWQVDAERQRAQDAGDLAKANQVCWLCEERRSCVRTSAGWECSTCRSVTT